MIYEINKIYQMTVLFADAKGRYVNVQSPEKKVFKVDIEGQLAKPPKSLSGHKVDVICTGDAIDVQPNFMLAEKYFSPVPSIRVKGMNLQLNEGMKIEFKKSIIFSSATNQPGHDRIIEIAREIAAFMNADGGDLYFGVDDEGCVIGIENDLPVLSAATICGINGKTDEGWTYKPTKDGFSQKLRNIVRFHLGDFASSLVGDPEFIKDETSGLTYVKLSVKPSTEEFIYLGPHENVYYRTGTSAALLEGRSRELYARFRFRNFIPTSSIHPASETKVLASDSVKTIEGESATQSPIELKEEWADFKLPGWVDALIFDDLGAVYCKENCNMTVIDWNWDEIKKYLGTYFPRSYAESYCIFSNYFKSHHNDYTGKTQLSIFDFGCGTGGGTMGLIAAIEDYLPSISNIRIKALDGNKYALRMFELVFKGQINKRHITFKFDVVPVKIEDVYDLNVTVGVLNEQFDFVITFKAICEMVSKVPFEQGNPYDHVLRSLLPKLGHGGIMCLVDITCKVNNKWLPELIDQGISRAGPSVEIVGRNSGFNETFHVTHSHAKNDLSKIAWILLRRKER